MGLFDWLKPPPPLDRATQALVDKAVDAVDPLLRQVHGFERRLAPPVLHAMDYCTGLAARIPGPFEISRTAFATDPLVHALFGSADDIETMLGRSQCVHEELFNRVAHDGRCCALLGMRHRERAGFGLVLESGIVHADVPQKTLYFTDHTLAEPSPDVMTARQRLGQSLFDSLLKGFAAHVDDVRAEKDDLKQAHAFAQARERSGRTPDSHTRRLAELAQRLRATTDALQPAALLATLADALKSPDAYLQLDPVSVSVDRTGVITGRSDDGSGMGADLLHFAELTSRDKRRWVVILAHIDREDARRALDRFEQAHRYIVI